MGTLNWTPYLFIIDMKSNTIQIQYEQLHNSELSKSDKQLFDFAVNAAMKAYAPYSKFHVGAALLLSDGTIVCGNNQENIAYPSGLCAERVALFSAGAQYPDKAVIAIAIAAVYNDTITDTISPCGSCCQVLLETEQRFKQKIRILLCGKEETKILKSVSSLLPFSFGIDSF